MAKSVIMLASTFDSSKMQFPYLMSEKIDGVAADFYCEKKGSKYVWVARTRTGEAIPAASHIVNCLNDKVRPARGRHIIGELHIYGKNFQYISGVSRRLVPDAETAQLVLHAYDYYVEGEEETDFQVRYQDLVFLLPPHHPYLKYAGQTFILTEDQYLATRHQYRKHNKYGRPTGTEGAMMRAPSGKTSYYVANKRPKGFAKDKLVETIDIPLLGFEEAIDKKTQAGLGMVGRLISEVDGQPTGVGPGTLTHAERIRIFNEWPRDKGRTMEVTAMPDVGYKALREGRFTNWRDDK